MSFIREIRYSQIQRDVLGCRSRACWISIVPSLLRTCMAGTSPSSFAESLGPVCGVKDKIKVQGEAWPMTNNTKGTDGSRATAVAAWRHSKFNAHVRVDSPIGAILNRHWKIQLCWEFLIGLQTLKHIQCYEWRKPGPSWQLGGSIEFLKLNIGDR